MSALRVLLVEDDPGYARLLREMLGEGRGVDYEIEWVSDLESGLKRLGGGRFDIVLLDLGLPDADGTEAVVRTCKAAPRVPIVVLSSSSDVDVALESMRVGAQEYLVKGQAEAALLPRAIRYALERKRIQDFEPMLIGIVGHDLRGPLQTIHLGAALLEKSGTVDPRDARTVRRIALAVARATSLVEDLLDVTRARLLGQVIRIERADMDIEAVVRQAVDDFRFANVNRQLVYTVTGPTKGRFDAQRIGQVLANLLRNAEQHGSPTAVISVSLRGHGGTLEIAVHNDGPSIPAALLPHLFEPMRRGDVASKQGHSGLGLGLYIVRLIAEAHGGNVEVTSTAETGTTITVTLPGHVAAGAGDVLVNQQ